MTLYKGNDRNYQNPVYDKLLDEAATTYALECQSAGTKISLDFEFSAQASSYF